MSTYNSKKATPKKQKESELKGKHIRNMTIERKVYVDSKGIEIVPEVQLPQKPTFTAIAKRSATLMPKNFRNNLTIKTFKTK